jgi:hypothetical protein
VIVSEQKGTQALAAYVAMQVGLTNPIHDAKANTGTYSYAYLSLPALLEHVAKARREAGLAIAQEVTGDDGNVAVTTYLIHLEGGYVAFGPVISYARRYSLLAALGLAAEDDDAASATGVTAEVIGEGGRSGPPVADDPSGGAGDLGGTPPLPSPDDIGATQRHYHPGKPHDMIHSPHAPALEICTRNGCTFNRRAA